MPLVLISGWRPLRDAREHLLDRATTLAMKANPSGRFVGWFHQLSNCLKDCGDLLVVPFYSLFQLS